MVLRSFGFAVAVLALTVAASAQQGSSSDKSTPKNPASQGSTSSTPGFTPPRSDRVQADELGPELGESSSKDTHTDLTPPEDDAKAHPKSSTAVAEASAELGGASGITEFHTWDPHKAAKSIEIGDFYFKRRNYRAAQDRYREALRYKDNDAVATIRLAICLEKLGVLDDARAEYESYLRSCRTDQSPNKRRRRLTG
jgi:Flp pilus assembly protein TadD